MSILSGKSYSIGHAKHITNMGNDTHHPYHRDHSDDDYERLRAIYYPVRKRVQEFFIEKCPDDDLDAIHNRLQRSGIRTPVFKNKRHLVQLRNYVMSQRYPTGYKSMESFLSEVVVGKLEFLSHYRCGILKEYHEHKLVASSSDELGKFVWEELENIGLTREQKIAKHLKKRIKK